jgi:hypothetical protein
LLSPAAAGPPGPQVTFSEHTAPVKAVTFTKGGSVALSASVDGTVRAFDLLRCAPAHRRASAPRTPPAPAMMNESL